jgi:hypothetical protein
MPWWVRLLLVVLVAAVLLVISGVRAWRRFERAKPDIFLDEQRRDDPPSVPEQRAE